MRSPTINVVRVTEEAGRAATPRREGLRKKDGWLVRDVQHKEAAEFISSRHYTGGCANTSVSRPSLFCPDGNLVGATMWMPPTPGSQAWAIRKGFARPIMLSRMVIEDFVPKNGASFLLSRACRILLHKGFDLAVTWADPIEGHDGSVYLVSGWKADGVSPAATRWVDGAGRVRSRVCGPSRLTVQECRDRGWSSVKGKPKPRFVRTLT